MSGAVSLMAAQAVVLVLGYATHLWIGRVLGPAPYGVYGIVLSIQTILGLFLTLGVPMAISRFVAQDERHAQSILRQGLRIQLTFAVILAALTALASPLLARALGDAPLTSLIRFVALVLLLQAGYPIYIQFFSGMHRFNKQAALTSLYAVAKLAGALSLIYFLGVYGAFAGFAIGGIIAAFIGWAWTRHVGGTKPHKLSLNSFLSFAGTYVLILFCLQLLISLDLFMVKAILKDDTQAGYYNSAVTLSRISYMLLQSLTFILLPSVSALTKPGADHDRAAIFIKDTIRYIIALIVPSVALAAVTSKSLIHLFFSTEYTPASTPLSILMVGVGALGFFLLLANIVAGAGKSKVGLMITVLLLIISAILGTVLIPQYGITGAAWQTTITGLIGLLILGIYTFRTFKIPVPVMSIVNIVTASIIITIIANLVPVTPLLLPLLYIALLALYVLLLFILREIKPADRARFAEIHPKLRFIAPK